MEKRSKRNADNQHKNYGVVKEMIMNDSMMRTRRLFSIAINSWVNDTATPRQGHGIVSLEDQDWGIPKSLGPNWGIVEHQGDMGAHYCLLYGSNGSKERGFISVKKGNQMFSGC